MIRRLIILLLIVGCEELLDPDTTAPTVVITYPVGGSTLTATITIRTDVTDNSDISSVKFLIDGIEAYADTTSPYEYEWDVCLLGTGSHSLLVKAEDSAGNKGLSNLLTLTINASYDCESVCGGDKLLDNCEVCDADTTNDCTADADCNGDYGGTAVLDDCNDCVGGNTELEPNYAKDDCGICDGNNAPNTGTCDCNSTPNGTAVVDCADVCSGDSILSGCDNVCNSTAVVDCIGVCGGDVSCECDSPVCMNITNVDTDDAGCTDPDYTTQSDCEAAGIITTKWYTGTLDIYMTNTAGCSYCDDPLYNTQTLCETNGWNNGTGVWTFDATIDEATCGLATTDGVYFDGQVKGFQIGLSGVTVISASGGSSKTADFFMQVSESTVLGFSFGAAGIPAGAGTLTTISFSNFDGIGICLPYNQDGNPTTHTPVISDVSGNQLDTEVGDCYTIP